MDSTLMKLLKSNQTIAKLNLNSANVNALLVYMANFQFNYFKQIAKTLVYNNVNMNPLSVNKIINLDKVLWLTFKKNLLPYKKKSQDLNL